MKRIYAGSSSSPLMCVTFSAFWQHRCCVCVCVCGGGGGGGGGGEGEEERV